MTVVLIERGKGVRNGVRKWGKNGVRESADENRQRVVDERAIR